MRARARHLATHRRVPRATRALSARARAVDDVRTPRGRDRAIESSNARAVDARGGMDSGAFDSARDASTSWTRARERHRCALCWGTIACAVRPLTCEHATCEACFRLREAGSACTRCGEAYESRATARCERDRDLDREIAEFYKGREEWADVFDDDRALRFLKRLFGYAESRAFEKVTARELALELKASTTKSAETRTRAKTMWLDEDTYVYHVELLPAEGDASDVLERRFVSARGTTKVGALARVVERQGIQVAAMCDVFGSAYDWEDSLDEFFAITRACSRPYVARYRTKKA